MPSKTWKEFKLAFKAREFDDKLVVLDRQIVEKASEVNALQVSVEQMLTAIKQKKTVDKSKLLNLNAALAHARVDLNGLIAQHRQVGLEKMLAASDVYDTLLADELDEDITLADQAKTTASRELGTENMKCEILEGAMMDAEDELHAFLAGFPALKLLLDAMNSAKGALTTRSVELASAKSQLQTSQLAFKIADEALIDVSDGTTPVTKADTLIDQFQNATKDLQAKQKAVRDAEAAQELARVDLEKKTAGLEQAIQAHLSKVSTPETLDKDNELLRLYAALKYAKVALTNAEAGRKQAQDDLEIKSLALKRLQDRKAMLVKRAAVKKIGISMTPTLRRPELADMVIWDQSVSVLQSKLGTDFDAFARISNDFMMKLEELTKLGMSREELRELYEDLAWPEKWWPPFMRKQEQNWVLVKGFLEQEEESVRKEKEAQATLGSLIRTGIDNQDTVVTNIAEALDITGVTSAADAAKLDKWLTLFSSIALLASAGEKAVSTLSSRDLDSQDPVEQLMAIDDALNNVATLGSKFMGTAQSTLDLVTATAVAEAVPIIGAIDKFASMCQNSIKAANTWIAAMADAKVHQEAVSKGHRAEGATDLVQKRGKHVASRKTADAAADVLQFTGYICDITGVGKPIGSAIKATGSVVSGVKSVVSWAVDTTRASEARKLLTDARAGNPIARAEIFRYHGRYACALIAILAKEEGDPIALSIYNNHDITEDMVTKSSVRILKKYLMREVVEENEPTTWGDWGDWFSDTGKSITKWFGKVGNFFSDLGQCVQPFFLATPTDQDLAEADLAVLKLGATGVEYVRRGVEDIIEARKQFESLKIKVAKLSEDAEDYETAVSARTAAQKKLTEFEKAVAKAQADVTKTMKEAARLIGLMDKEQTQGGPYSTVQGKIGEGSKRRFRELIDEQRRCLTLLAQVT